MSPNDADGMANSVDPDQTTPLGAVWSGSALFAQAYLSENLGSLQYDAMKDCPPYQYKHISKGHYLILERKAISYFKGRSSRISKWQ